MDKPGEQSVKTSEIKFVKLGSVGSLLNPFIQFCISANVNAFGFIKKQNADKIKFNIYDQILSIIGILMVKIIIQLEI